MRWCRSDRKRWTGRRGWYEGDLLIDVDDGSEELRVPLDNDPLAHIRRGKRRIRMVSNLAPRSRRSRTNIRPFMLHELRAILHEVGPRASERETDKRPCRDRLMFDIGWTVGLRLDEIHQLTTLQFLSKISDAAKPFGLQALTVTGKGNKQRIVSVPNWLWLDALHYIEGERAASLKAGAISSRAASKALFLSGPESKRPGRPIGHRRMQQVLAETCLRLGLVELVEVTDPQTGETHTIKRPRHCIHDLRHTYAVVTYWAEKKHGNPEPWKKIQAQLGHEHLSTTINTYLAFVDIFGEQPVAADVRTLVGV